MPYIIACKSTEGISLLDGKWKKRLNTLGPKWLGLGIRSSWEDTSWSVKPSFLYVVLTMGTVSGEETHIVIDPNWKEEG